MKTRIRLITAGQAARELGVHPKTVSRLLRQGTLMGIKLANRWLIEQDTIETFRQHYIGRKGRPKGWSPKKEA